MLASWRRDLGRWAWLLPFGVLASLGLALVASRSATPTYTATREVLFLSPPLVPSANGPDEFQDINPFLNFSPTLNTAAAVVALTVTDERTADVLAPEGSGVDFSVYQLPATSAPVLAVDANASTASDADSLADTLVEVMEKNLVAQQRAADAPESTWIQTSVVGASAEPARDWSNEALMAMIGFAAGVALTALLLAGLLRVRAARRIRPGSPEPDQVPDPTESAGDEPSAPHRSAPSTLTV